MKSPSNEKRFEPLPPSQFRCVWMAAGILSYQLCDREFDCDNCALNNALSMHFDRVEQKHRRSADIAKQSSSQSTVHPEGQKEQLLPSDLLYTNDHLWVKKVEDEIYRIGIEPGLAALLVGLKAIVAPRVGDVIKRGQPCLWIVLDDSTLPILAPFDGPVRIVHEELRQQPSLVHSGLFEHGWLFEMMTETRNTGMTNLITSGSAHRVYAKHQERFQYIVSHTLSMMSISGATLADGGELLSSIREMLGSRKFCALIQEIFH